MIFQSRTRVCLTDHELNSVRRAAARQGVVVNRIETPAELFQALLDALPAPRRAELLRFLETADHHARRRATDDRRIVGE